MSRVALVTGGASGIGRETCLALADAGRRVAVADIQTAGANETAATIRSAGGQALAVTIDITHAASVDRGVRHVEDELGPVEILANVAGWDQFMKFVDTDEDFWDRIIDVNFKGMLRTTHRCLPAMIDGGWGRIVNVASDAGRVGSSLEAVYSGAKGGTIAFTKTLAREVARRGITANVVCPGPTDTPLLDEIASANPDSDRVLGAMANAVPMKRVGRPEEVATAVVYFASEGASFTTGQTLSVSGGLTMA
ncbi:SDR family NAD(P)-dependent oxidoreductase [Ilumatobacter sp.]|uniref:SDR family NAD(P)-dependent oxidoreductase n=1 Tax=Ilumatobacter sp. TaxID=1967498 RepID=UPI003AF7C731